MDFVWSWYKKEGQKKSANMIGYEKFYIFFHVNCVCVCTVGPLLDLWPHNFVNMKGLDTNLWEVFQKPEGYCQDSLTKLV